MVRSMQDLPGMYEAATVEDVYAAYAGLALDDASLFSCVGVSGTEAPQVRTRQALLSISITPCDDLPHHHHHPQVKAPAAQAGGAAADAYAALAAAMRKAGGEISYPTETLTPI